MCKCKCVCVNWSCKTHFIYSSETILNIKFREKKIINVFTIFIVLGAMLYSRRPQHEITVELRLSLTALPTKWYKLMTHQDWWINKGRIWNIYLRRSRNFFEFVNGIFLVQGIFLIISFCNSKKFEFCKENGPDLPNTTPLDPRMFYLNIHW